MTGAVVVIVLALAFGSVGMLVEGLRWALLMALVMALAIALMAGAAARWSGSGAGRALQRTPRR